MSNKKSNIKITVYGVLTALFVLFIWSNSMQSGEESGALSLDIVNFIKPILDPHNKIDLDTFHFFVRKLAHFSEFGVLGVLVSGLVDAVGERLCVKYISIRFFWVLFVACCDEFIQNFTGRGSAVTDVAIDFGGGVCGILGMMLSLWIIRKIRSKRSAKQN